MSDKIEATSNEWDHDAGANVGEVQSTLLLWFRLVYANVGEV
jgi:hypothetical protein